MSCDGKRAATQYILSRVLCTGNASYLDQPTQVGTSLASSALPVSAERVAVPEKPSTRWSGCVGGRESRSLASSGTSVTVSRERKKLDWQKSSCRRAWLLVEKDMLPRTRSGQLLTGGLFCVAKNSSEDRLIFDRRPENGTMPSLD